MIVLIFLAVVAVVALICFGLFGFGLLGKIERDQRKAERNADSKLDEMFDGSSDVTFSGHMRSMKYETVILGAKKRGYVVTHESGNPSGAFTLIFEKSQANPAS